jgi:thioredoxin-related protein
MAETWNLCNSVILQSTIRASIKQTKLLMLYSEITADYCKTHKKHQVTLSKIHTGLMHNTWYTQEALWRIQ